MIAILEHFRGPLFGLWFRKNERSFCEIFFEREWMHNSQILDLVHTWISFQLRGQLMSILSSLRGEINHGFSKLKKFRGIFTLFAATANVLSQWFPASDYILTFASHLE